MANGTPANVTLGAGLLYAAPVATASPTDATTALAAAYKTIGYTDSGSTFTSNLTTAGIEVAEEIEDIATYATKRTSTVTFEMAETTGKNLALSLNQGVLASPPSSVSPVAPSAEVRVKLVWQGDQGQRWVFSQCYQTGSVAIANKKAPDKRLIAVEFTLEIPTAGATFVAFPNAAGLI